jgi:lipopolysaccharide transport system permease protein
MSVAAVGQALDILRALVRREMHIRYKGSILGVLWAVLSPLGTVLILHMLFTRLMPLNIPHYAAFIYSGLLPWAWFQAAVQAAAATLIDNRDLVRRPFFPRPLLPFVVTVSQFQLYLLAFPVLILLLLAEGVALSPFLLLLPAVWIVQGLFTLACTILFAALGVLIRDVQHLLGVIMTLWFYLTPVFYDLDRVAPAHAWWLRLNPMAVLVEAHRSLALLGQAPDWGALGLAAALSLVLLAASLAFFRLLEHELIEQV